MEITWEWLGGFVQAEGHINTPYWLDISQARREPLDMIHDFLLLKLPNAPARIYGLYKNKGRGIYQLRIHKNHQEVLNTLHPYLRSEKHARACTHLSTIAKMLPINNDWIMGFWEGDGFIRANILGFCQKDRTVLDEIQQHLDLGTVRPHANIYRLSISVNKTNVKRIGELLSLIRTPPRLEQLKRILS